MQYSAETFLQVQSQGGNKIRHRSHQKDRRRIKTEEKAKVVAAVWGTEFDLFPCHTSYFAPG